MIHLFENRFLNINALSGHFRAYYFYYLMFVLLPLLYNKITYNYTWTDSSVFSYRFGSLFLLTMFVIVFITAISLVIQLLFTYEDDKQDIVWKKGSARVLFYVLPIGLGLCILIAFKYIWYEGEQMYAILWEHAKSRFLLYLVMMIAFSIWLDTDRKRNLLITYFQHEYPPTAGEEQKTYAVDVIDRPIEEQRYAQMDTVIEKFSQVVEDKLTTVLDNKLHDRNEEQVSLVKKALIEFVTDHQVQQDKTEQMLGHPPLKEIVKEAIEEWQSERDDLPDEVLLENLYASLYAKSPTKLMPSFNELGAVVLFHIFAIESHTKHAVVILTDGTRIDSPKILETLKNLGLLIWLVKVNKNHYINMMHVCFMDYKNGQFVKIQSQTIQALSTNLTKSEVLKICTLGSKVKNKYIEEFLKSRFELRYRGWNACVPLS
ncbi:hypothetical protein [Sphingobacterium faecium]|uniref:hypothetical protein n=1 Tax=Sphingobacterium faecium TaxID=34087 RepID=UPI000D34B999|nr:hypothetical protein [Sphingobacterium faecium]PTX11847.1 hypothetical protein C8N37_103424 [Sphingobacterium faecium]